MTVVSVTLVVEGGSRLVLSGAAENDNYSRVRHTVAQTEDGAAESGTRGGGLGPRPELTQQAKGTLRHARVESRRVRTPSATILEWSLGNRR